MSPVIADRKAIRAKVERTTQVVTIPQVVARVTALVDSGRAAASELADEIGKDPVLVAKVLRLVNSGFYGFRQPVSTVSRATVLLGQDVLKTLVLSASVLEVMDKMNDLMAGLWEHSTATARIAGLLSEQLRIGKPEEVALSGLLHDVGKVIIAQTFPREHQRIRAFVERERSLLIEAEHEVLGVGHPEVGLWLLSRWALPNELVYPIAYHASVHPARDFADRTAIVHVADVLARAKGIGNPGDQRIPRIQPEAWQLLGLTMAHVEDALARYDAEQSLRTVA